MKLKDYLNEHDETYSSFASRIDVAPESVRRYANNERIPRAKIMQKIEKATNGLVTPVGFYQ